MHTPNQFVWNIHARIHCHRHLCQRKNQQNPQKLYCRFVCFFFLSRFALLFCRCSPHRHLIEFQWKKTLTQARLAKKKTHFVRSDIKCSSVTWIGSVFFVWFILWKIRFSIEIYFKVNFKYIIIANKMGSIRINLSMALITLVVLISTLEVQRGVLAIEQVSNFMQSIWFLQFFFSFYYYSESLCYSHANDATCRHIHIHKTKSTPRHCIHVKNK